MLSIFCDAKVLHVWIILSKILISKEWCMIVIMLVPGIFRESLTGCDKPDGILDTLAQIQII